MAQTFEIAGPDIAAEEFDGEYVVLNLKSGMYFSVGPGAALVWKALMAGHSVEALLGGVRDTDPRAAEIQKAVAAFVDNGLIVAANRQPTAALGEPASLLAQSEADFRVDAYGDLADLLIADPIHDVDEQVGWPKRPQDA